MSEEFNRINQQDKELQAINYKIEHPDEEVICPICGKRLIFTKYYCGWEVKCETEGCLRDALRGL